MPVVLTLAPDPHASVAAREADGVLTRQNVGRADEVEHLVFRIHLLRQIQQQAAQLVVFPRPALAANLRDLLGVDLDIERDRVTVVPEGIDPVPLDRAAREVPAAARGEYAPAATLDALDDLDDLLHTLPPERRGLPLAVTVGRLHPVKGMATLVRGLGRPSRARRAMQPPHRRRRPRAPERGRARAARPHRRHGGSRRRASGRAAAGRTPTERDGRHLAGGRPLRPARSVRSGWRLRLREPQGGVRHRDPRGDGIGAGRGGAPGGWAGDLRRGRCHRRTRRHPLAGRPRGRRRRRARPGLRAWSRTPGRGRPSAWSGSGSASTPWPRPSRRSTRDVAL